MFDVLWTRLIITLVIILVGSIGYYYYWQSLPSQLNLQMIKTENQPTILYFSAPDCVPCHTVQAPALKLLSSIVNDKINIIEIDTSIETELAKKWKVLSVPTLIILDSKGELAKIKHGVQSAPALLTEIQPLTR